MICIHSSGCYVVRRDAMPCVSKMIVGGIDVNGDARHRVSTIDEMPINLLNRMMQ